MDWRENAKKMAARKAVEHVKEKFVVGLGSGTTVIYAIRELGKRIREEGLRIYAIPTSYQTTLLAAQHEIPTTTLHEHPSLNVTIDGADQVDEALNLIKGMGGALTREKIVASASKLNVIVVDETKLTKNLGSNQPVPLEVLPFALAPAAAQIRKLGGKPILRESHKKVGPVITDNGNVLLDVHFGAITDPKELNRELKVIPGVVETGLFVGMANLVYIGTRRNVRKLAAARSS